MDDVVHQSPHGTLTLRGERMIVDFSQLVGSATETLVTAGDAIVPPSVGAQQHGYEPHLVGN